MPTMSASEKARRIRINESVAGTHAMEGLQLDQQTLNLMRMWEDGEIDADQLSEALHAYGMSLVESTRAVGAA